jgi:hypothetical protein
MHKAREQMNRHNVTTPWIVRERYNVAAAICDTLVAVVHCYCYCDVRFLPPNLYNTHMDVYVDVYQCLEVALLVECALRTEYQFMHLTHTITYTNTVILVLVIKLHCYWFVVLLQAETWRWQWMSKSSLVRNTTAMSCWLGSMNLYRPGSQRWSKHAQVG